MLKQYIDDKRKEKDILLMTHIVIGYPDFDTSYRIVKQMVEAGVDLMELQIPFSEPVADGPVILHANQVSLQNGATVTQCLEFGAKVAGDFSIPFLYMSYYNILYKFGITEFTRKMKESGIRGAIVPDLPLEEGADYLHAMAALDLAPVFIFSPRTDEERMREMAAHAEGFIYCVARKGVTGLDTDFSRQIETYLDTCRRAAGLPIAVGFGVKERKDIDFLKNKADIAVIGTQTIRIVDTEGVDAVGGFIRGLR